MPIDKDSIVMFYELLGRFDRTSPNIGVTGTKREFEAYIKKITKAIPKNKGIKLIINPSRTKVTILQDDIEITYIHIENTDNMVGYKFKKYI